MKFNYLFSLILISGITTNAQYQQYTYSDQLTVNQVNAMVHSNGQFFWDMQGMALYEVPKTSGRSTIFALMNWIGGYHNDTLHLAANNYNQKEFIPGIIMDINQLEDTLSAQLYGKIWHLHHAVVQEFINEFALGNVLNGTYTVPGEILDWPGDHPTTGEMLAPYSDVNTDGVYNPMLGDYPLIKGCEMLWWVFNDNTVHEASGGRPLGVEYRVSFYAHTYSGIDEIADALNYMTFLDFEIVNRSNNIYTDTRVAWFTDFDLGYSFDDLVGCDVPLSSFFIYNALDIDGSGQINAYGGPVPAPPSQSLTILKGPEADNNDGFDNNHNGITDEQNECWALRNFMNFQNVSGPTSNPIIDFEFYNYMNSVWKDGTPLLHGGNGYGSGANSNVEAKFMYPGSSDITGWGTGMQVMDAWFDNQLNAGDRRGMGACGPFTFEVGEKLEISLALSYARSDSAGAYNSVIKNLSQIETLFTWHENDSYPGDCTPVTGNEEIIAERLKLYPNPAREKLYVDLPFYSEQISCQIKDILGKDIPSAFELNEGRLLVDLGGINIGVYSINITLGNKHFNEVFIKR
jgi:hypothetical protein